MKRNIELQRGQSLKFEPHINPPMNGHVLLATSPNPTKSSCNRQEEGKPPTSHRCMYHIRANDNERVFFGSAYGLGSQRERVPFFCVCFCLDCFNQAVAGSKYDDGVVITVPFENKGFIPGISAVGGPGEDNGDFDARDKCAWSTIRPRICRSDIDGVHALSPMHCSRHDRNHAEL